MQTRKVEAGVSGPTILILSTIILFAGIVVGQEMIVVGANVQVSSSHSDWDHNEVILAAHPTDPSRLLAGSMFLDPKKGTYSVVTYVSFDGGTNWKPTLKVGDEGGMYADPATAFGCDGSAYSVSLKASGWRDELRTLVHHSNDGGRTWLPPTVLPFSDREFITVDCTTSKYRGRVYIHGNIILRANNGGRVAGTAIFRSTDQGKSFSQQIILPAPGRNSSYQGNSVILSDGTYIAPFTDFSDDDVFLRAIRSEDGGNNFSIVTVSKRNTRFGLVSFAAHQSAGPYRDRIYAVWTDQRDERDVILLSYSADKGRTWSSPVVVNDDKRFSDGRRGPDDYMGAVAVNREGIVGVSWYDRRESTNDQDWFVRFAASFDGGRTFTPSVKVSEAPFSHDWSKLKGFQFHATGGGSYGEVRDPTLFLGVSPSEAYVNGGDTAGLAASIDGVFHAVWIDNRTNIPQVWTTPITVNPPAVTIDILRKSQNLNDITKDTTIDFGETNFDPTTKIVSANLYLVNTSDETLAGPMVLHVVRLDQSAEILNADNGQKGKDATFEYTSLMNDNKLRPGEKTKAKLIRLRLFGQKGNPNTGESAEPGTVMTTEVFGKKASTKP